MIKIFYFIVFFFSNIYFWYANEIRDWLLWWTEENVWWSDINQESWLGSLSSFFSWLKSEMMAVVAVVSVAIFIYIWIKFATARWNPEEFKKAWMHFIYAVLWIFLVFMSLWIVTLVSNLDL